MKIFQVDSTQFPSAEESELWESCTPVPCCSRASSPWHDSCAGASSSWPPSTPLGLSRPVTPNVHHSVDKQAALACNELNEMSASSLFPFLTDFERSVSIAPPETTNLITDFRQNDQNSGLQLSIPELFGSGFGDMSGPSWPASTIQPYQTTLTQHSSAQVPSDYMSSFHLGLSSTANSNLSQVIDPSLGKGTTALFTGFEHLPTVKLEDITDDKLKSGTHSPLLSLCESLPTDDGSFENTSPGGEERPTHRRRERRVRRAPDGQVQQPEPRVVCPICKAEFSRRHNLNTHMHIHDPNRERFGCDYCDMTFTRPKDRQRHILTIHKRVNKYKCVCGRAFPRSDSLKRHIATRGPESHVAIPLPETKKKSDGRSNKNKRGNKTSSGIATAATTSGNSRIKKQTSYGKEQDQAIKSATKRITRQQGSGGYVSPYGIDLSGTGYQNGHSSTFPISPYHIHQDQTSLNFASSPARVDSFASVSTVQSDEDDGEPTHLSFTDDEEEDDTESVDYEDEDYTPRWNYTPTHY